MKKIIYILLIGFVSLSAGTLRLLNIPVNSTILIKDKSYKNEKKRSLDVVLEKSGILSNTYSIVIQNEDFIPCWGRFRNVVGKYQGRQILLRNIKIDT